MNQKGSFSQNTLKLILFDWNLFWDCSFELKLPYLFLKKKEKFIYYLYITFSHYNIKLKKTNK